MKFLDYIKGSRKGKEAQRIELEAMRDPLLGDAVEGYDRVPGDHDAALERLRARIAERSAAESRPAAQIPSGNRRRALRNWSIAAAVVLICLTTGALMILLKDPALQQPTLALDTPAAGDTLSNAESTLAAATGMPKDETKKKVEEPARQMIQEVKKFTPPVISPEEVLEDADIVISDAAFSDSAVMADEYVQPVAELKVSETPVQPAKPAEEVEAKVLDHSISGQLSGRLAGVAVKQAKSKPGRSAVSGRVVEAGTGEPVSGAVILVEGSKSGTVTGTDGSFLISGVESNAELSASLIGYQTATIPVNTDNVMLIAMKPDSHTMDDVVVVGYGTQRKETLVGSASKIAAAPASVPVLAPADTTTTPPFRRYLAGELAKLADGSGPEGSATLEFEVDELGRPIRITATAGSSPEARREAVRILRGGPGWEPSEGKRRITIVFRAE